MGVLNQIDQWPPSQTAAGWIDIEGRSERHGPTGEPFALASITKALFAYGVLVAIEEGSLDLKQPAGPPGSTIRHLLSHCSGLGFVPSDPIKPVGERRIYSNVGFDVIGEKLAAASGMPPSEYWRLAVAEPLGMTATSIPGSVAHAGVSTVDDLLIFAAELLNPTLVTRQTLDHARSPQFGKLDGVLPGFGQYSPNPWGLGFELRGDKFPHWTGQNNSPATFGHFGAKGTMMWVDPALGKALVCLSDLDFGLWAKQRWGPLSDQVIAAS